MITPEQVEAIKTLTKRGFGLRVSELLTQRKVTNSKGKSYDAATISLVMSGDRENLDIEDAIFEIIRQEKEKHVDRNSLLGIN